jgi:hypothetical protein
MYNPLLNEALWNMVNRCCTREQVATAEKVLKDSDIDNELYDDLMRALSYISRELYHNA